MDLSMKQKETQIQKLMDTCGDLAVGVARLNKKLRNKNHYV